MYNKCTYLYESEIWQICYWSIQLCTSIPQHTGQLVSDMLLCMGKVYIVYCCIIILCVSFTDPTSLSGDDDRNALHWAAFYSNPELHTGSSKLEALKYMLNKLVTHVELLNSKDRYGDTPLHIACMRSNNVAIEILLSHDVNINEPNDDGWTPLHRGCWNDNERVVELLMKKKPDCLKRCNEPESRKEMIPLHFACMRGHNKIASIILSSCSDEIRSKMLDAKDSLGNTPLHIACEKINTELVDILLKSEANPHELNKNDFTPLFVAAKNGFVSILKLMLRRGPIDLIKEHANKYGVRDSYNLILLLLSSSSLLLLLLYVIHVHVQNAAMKT